MALLPNPEKQVPGDKGGWVGWMTLENEYHRGKHFARQVKDKDRERLGKHTEGENRTSRVTTENYQPTKPTSQSSLSLHTYTLLFLLK
jgi:hypothetical protein